MLLNHGFHARFHGATARFGLDGGFFDGIDVLDVAFALLGLLTCALSLAFGLLAFAFGLLSHAAGLGLAGGLLLGGALALFGGLAGALLLVAALKLAFLERHERGAPRTFDFANIQPVGQKQRQQLIEHRRRFLPCALVDPAIRAGLGRVV